MVITKEHVQRKKTIAQGGFFTWGGGEGGSGRQQSLTLARRGSPCLKSFSFFPPWPPREGKEIHGSSHTSYYEILPLAGTGAAGDAAVGGPAPGSARGAGALGGGGAGDSGVVAGGTGGRAG